MVNSENYSRGAEWRKWDLQVHTPYSVLNNEFGDDFSIYAKKLFELVAKQDIAVVGITDYFYLEGYKKIRELLADQVSLCDLVGEEVQAKVNRTLFLPNIELRSSTIIQSMIRVSSKQ